MARTRSGQARWLATLSGALWIAAERLLDAATRCVASG
jgi:hypothetical protein